MNWTIIALLAAGAFTVLGAEIAGIVRHDDHKTDTVSELWWRLRDRLGPYSAAVSFPLAVFLGWLWYHFTFDGRRRRNPS